MSHRIGIRHALVLLAGLLALPLLVLGVGSAPASAANVVNYTFHVPADIRYNPCTGTPGDAVNLNGDVHIVITSTAAGNGSYRMDNLLNSEFSGVSILTGTKYVSSEEHRDFWTAKPPFPVTQTTDYAWTLVSQSSTPNYIVRMSMHTTVTADGTPVPVVDNWRMDCTG